MASDLQYLRDEGRIGRVLIHTSYLFDSRIRAFLGQCVIVRAERGFACGDTVEYQMFHPELPPANMGAEVQLFEAYVDPTGRVRLVARNEAVHVEGVELLVSQ